MARQNGIDVTELRRRVQADGMTAAQFREDLRSRSCCSACVTRAAVQGEGVWT